MFFCCGCAVILIILGVAGERKSVNRVIIKVKTQQKQIIFHRDKKRWHVKIYKNHESNSKTELLEEKRVAKKEFRNSKEKAFRGKTCECEKNIHTEKTGLINRIS